MIRAVVRSIAVLGLIAAGLVAATAANASPPSRPYRLGPDGTTAPIYSYTHAIRQTVWVDIGLDQDGDGIDDRVAADIIRPAEPARRHQRIPVIMEVSGYYESLGRGNQMQVKTYDKYGRPVQFPLFYDNYFVPRGYAVVLVDLAGTNRSTGCTDYGGESELRSSTRVIDWLNGRAPGYSSPLGTGRRYATWSDGRVGMIGKSWDGQNVVETAVTGIKGLDAAVPISAVTSDWTEFYDRTGSPSYLPTTADYTLGDPSLQNARAFANKHCQALLDKVNAGEPLNGDYTAEWAYRDWAPRAGRVRAAVLLSQGQNDTTVYPSNLSPFWQNLPRWLPKKIWLSEVGHVDPFDYRRAVWVDTLHRWFDRFLYRIHNEIERGPQLSVERAPAYWVNYPTFPATGARTVSLYPNTEPAGTGYAGGLAPQPSRSGVVAVPPSPETTQSIEFVSPRLTRPLRLSGTVDVVVSASTSTNVNVNYEAYVYDIGRTRTRGYSGASDSSREFTGILNPMTTQTCWGESGPGDSACYYVTPPDIVTVQSQFISWGTIDLWHRSSVRVTQPVVANRVYSLRIPGYMMDRILPAGHRVGVEIYAYPTDPSATASVHLAGTRVDLPVVGGRISLAG